MNARMPVRVTVFHGWRSVLAALAIGALASAAFSVVERRGIRKREPRPFAAV